MQTVMAGLEAAFAAFSGVPGELLFDQMRAVIVADERPGSGELLEKNAEFLRFAALGVSRPRLQAYRVQTKGKVERPIRYLWDRTRSKMQRRRTRRWPGLRRFQVPQLQRVVLAVRSRDTPVSPVSRLGSTVCSYVEYARVTHGVGSWSSPSAVFGAARGLTWRRPNHTGKLSNQRKPRPSPLRS